MEFAGCGNVTDVGAPGLAGSITRRVVFAVVPSESVGAVAYTVGADVPATPPVTRLLKTGDPDPAGIGLGLNAGILLQVGGVHDATTDVVPAATAVTVPSVPTVAEAGVKLDQVSGAPVIG